MSGDLKLPDSQDYSSWNFDYPKQHFTFSEPLKDFAPHQTDEPYDLEAVTQLNSCTVVLQEIVGKHSSLLTDFLTSSTDATLTSDLKASMQNLYNQSNQLMQAASSAMHEIDMLRNNSVLRVREFASLQATLVEAEQQLEQASEREHQLKCLKQAYSSLEKRLEHETRPNLPENRSFCYWTGHSAATGNDCSGKTVHLGHGSYTEQMNKTIPLHQTNAEEVESLQRLVTQLKTAQCKLDAQIEQSVELEALLAEREARIVTQSHELNDAESQLAASTQLISQLHKRLSANHEYLNDLLQQLSLSSPSTTVEQLPAIPAVLELASNLDAAYAELQDSERLRLIAERQASSATTTARQLRSRLRNMANKLESDPLDGIPDTMYPSVCTTSTQTLPNLSVSCGIQTLPSSAPDFNKSKTDTNSNTNASLDMLLSYALSRPSEVMAIVEEKEPTTPEQVIQLKEALRNAIIQVERLNKYRLAQKTKLDQMQQRFVQLNSELDATVDALRYHQTSSENERRRTASELSGLRMQLAKANAVLAHQRTRTFKLEPNSLGTCDSMQTVRASSMSPVAHRVLSQDKEPTTSSSEDLALQLTMAQSELAQLRADMTRQKADADRENTKLRGQLAESTADMRTLRLQLTRLQAVAENSQRNSGSDPTASADVMCSNCQRLQRLLDIIQRKANENTPVANNPVEQSGKSDEDNQSKEDLQNASVSQEILELQERLQKEKQQLEKQCSELLAHEKNLQSDCQNLSIELEHTRTQLSRTERDLEEMRASHMKELAHLNEDKIRVAHERKFLQEERRRLLEREDDLLRRQKEAESLILIAARNKQVFKDSLQAQLLEAGARQSEQQSLESVNTDSSLSTELYVVDSIAKHNRAVQTVVYERLSAAPDSNELNTAGLSQLIGEPTEDLALGLSDMDLNLTSSQLRSRYDSLQNMAEELLTIRSQLYDEQQALEKAKAEFRKMQESQSFTKDTACASAEPTLETLSHSDKAAKPEIASHEIPYNVLVHRLEAAEREAADAVAQLRASNSEFLTLRERVSHASVERAHLKSTIEGLDEQVSSLEACLYERTQQLNQCRDELAKATGRYVIPLSAALGGVHVSKTQTDTTLSRVLTQLNCSRHLSGLFHSLSSLPKLIRGRDSVSLPILDSSRGTYGSRHSYRTSFYQTLARIKSSLCTVLPSIPNGRVLCNRVVSIRSRMLIQSPPRPSVFLCVLLYLAFVHILLIYWII